MLPSFQTSQGRGTQDPSQQQVPRPGPAPPHVETPTESTACTALIASLHADEESEARLGPLVTAGPSGPSVGAQAACVWRSPRGPEVLRTISGAQDVPSLQALSSEVTPPWLPGKLHPFPWALSCVRCPSSDGPAPLPPKQHEDPDSRLTFQCGFLDAPSATSESQECEDFTVCSGGNV